MRLPAPRQVIARLLRDRSGASAMIVAGSLFLLVGAATVAIDFGSLYLAKRHLQGIADAAAMAAAGQGDQGGQNAAMAIINRSRAKQVTIGSLTLGRYRRDKAVPVNTRFTAGSTSPTAVRIVLKQQVPLFFGRVLSGKSGMAIQSVATASRTDMAAFSLGTRLAALSGGVPNQILSALAGTELGLTAADGPTLAGADIDILHYADALRVRVGKPDATYAELFDMQVPLSEVVGAMSDVASDTAIPILSRIESRIGGESIKLSDLIDLGPVGQSDSNDGSTQIKVDALSLLRTALELSHGDHYAVNLSASALGLTSTTLKLIGGQGEVHSPWMTVTESKEVVIRTSQTRIYIEKQIGTGPLGLAAVRFPLFIELASAEARLADIKCGSNQATDGVTLEVTPSIGKLAIADIDAAAMNDLTSPVNLRPAKLANTVLVQINGLAQVNLGGATSQTVHFTKDDIANRRVRSVVTNDLIGGIATSLLSGIQLSTSLLGIPLFGITPPLGPLTAAVSSLLGGAAPALDTLVNQLTGTLGLRLGVADVRVDKMKCGVPLLVS